MLKILVVNDVFPHINNRTTTFFRNIIPILSKKFEVKVFWIITDDYGEIYEETNPNYEILLMSDFKNAIEVFEKTKPDIVYHLVDWSVMDYAFMLAGRFLKIPSFGVTASAEIEYFADSNSKFKLISDYIKQFFEIKHNHIKKMRGINFLKKITFLLKTIYVIKKSSVATIIEILDFLNSAKPKSVIGRFSKFNCDLMFAEKPHQVKDLVRWGLKKENIVVVGNPVFDVTFENRKPSSKLNEKLRVLFITVNFSSGQGKSKWSKSNRNKMIKELITNLSNTNKISLTIKIHPTSENYMEYRDLLSNHKDVNLSQIDDIIGLLVESDVIITSCASTAGMIALIMNKPIIVWNYFHVERDLFLGGKVALECKNAAELYDCIINAEAFRKQNEEKINELIKEEFVDGKATQKIIFELERWLKNKELI